MALYPLGQYNYRVLDINTFTSLNGIDILYTNDISGNFITANLDIGRSIIEDRCHIYNELVRELCRGAVDYKPVNNNYSMGLKIERSNHIFSIYKNRIDLLADIDKFTDPYTKAMATLWPYLEVHGRGIGYKYDRGNFYIETELKKNIYYLKNNTSLIGSAPEPINIYVRSYYVLYGYNLTENLNVYASYSKSTDTLNRTAKNKVIGVSYTYDKFSLSAEYHKGFGKEWMRYDSPSDKWNSLVISGAYNF